MSARPSPLAGKIVAGKKQPDKFIAGAIKHPGALTAKAKAAGMTVQAYATAHQNDPGKTGQQCRFYLRVLRPASRR